jgi:hypothetical protein
MLLRMNVDDNEKPLRGEVVEVVESPRIELGSKQGNKELSTCLVFA